MPGMVLGHAATAVIALQHRHVAVACVVVWAWHVCGPGGVGGVRKNSARACHPGTHQAHTRHMPGRHTSCIWHAHTMHTLALWHLFSSKMLYVYLTAIQVLYVYLTVVYGIHYEAHVASMSFGNLGGTTT